MLSRRLIVLLSAAVLALASAPARAASFSHTGNFQYDDDVHLIFFHLDSPATVDLRTWQYDGGLNAAGVTIPSGGFDSLLTLFDAVGTFLVQNDDQASGQFDSRIQTALGSGDYILALTQFDNSHVGNLVDGFMRQGQHDFTGTGLATNCGGGMFFNYQCSQRTSFWAVDLKNVTTASAPEPSTLLLLGGGLGLLAARRRARRA